MVLFRYFKSGFFIATLILLSTFSVGLNSITGQEDTITRSSSDPTEIHQWAGFGYDSRNTHLKPDALDQNHGRLMWKTEINVDGQPVIDSNGILYCIGDLGLYAVNTTTGEVIWTVPHIRGNTPALGSDGTIYAIDNAETRGKLFAVSPDGVVKWSTESLDSVTIFSPSIDHDGNILFGSWNGFIYSYSPDGSLNWEYEMYGHVWDSFCFDEDSNIYFLRQLNHNPGYQFDLLSLSKTGLFRFQEEVQYSANSAVTMDDNGILYFTSSMPSPPYSIHAKRSTNGLSKWESPIDHESRSQPSITPGGNIIVGTQNGTVHCFDPDGVELWTFKVDEAISTNIAVDGNGNAYFGSRDHFFYSIDKNGIQNWKYETGHLIVGSHPCIDDDTNVYIGSYDGYLYSFGGWRPPSPPSNVTVTNGPGNVRLTWSSPLENGGANATGYRIYRKIGSEFELLDEVTEPTILDENLEPGSMIEYRISALNEFGEGKLSKILVGNPVGVPPPPGPVEIGIFDSELSFNWSIAAWDLRNYTITNFNIYKNNTLHSVISGGTHHFNDTRLVNGVNYFYQISCVNVIGEGERSPLINATPAWSPTSPRNFTVIPRTTQITLVWDTPEDERGLPVLDYSVFRRTGNGNWTGMTITSDTSWSDLHVVIGDTYEYFVDCRNEMGHGDRTKIISATVPMYDPPDLPSGLDYNFVNSNEIQISWDEPYTGPMPTGYDIYRLMEGTLYFAIVGTLDLTTFSDTSVIPGRNYTYYVVAFNAQGDGLPSDDLKVYVPVQEDQKNDPDASSNGLLLLLVIIGILVCVFFLMPILLIFLIIRRRNRSKVRGPVTSQPENIDGGKQVDYTFDGPVYEDMNYESSPVNVEETT